jgi:hypothetical protein
MDTLQIVAMLVVFILLLLFVYYFFKDDKGITSGLNDARYYKYIDSTEFGVPVGLKAAFATSIWVYVKDWNGTTGADKIICYIGSNIATDDTAVSASTGAAPSTTPSDDAIGDICGNSQVLMALDEDVPTLKIHVDGDEEFSINDFPLQTWVNITLSVYNDSLDLYINGKLVSSKIVENLLIEFPESDSAVVSLGNPFYVFDKKDTETNYTSLTMGFSGYTSKFKFFNNSLTPNEAYDIYKSGPGGSSLANMIGNRGLDINFKDGEEVTSTISI